MLRTVFINIILLSFFLVAISCQKKAETSLPYYNTPDFSPLFLSKDEADKKITHFIDGFSLKNQDDKVFSNKDVNGKIEVVSFLFTSCSSICPTMVENLKVVDKAYQKDNSVSLLSFTVTPWLDTPKRLKEFKENHKIENPNWIFLTGKKNEIYTLARKSYFAEEDLGYSKDSTNFLHTEHVVLVDKKKRIRGIYNGTLKTDMLQLVDDISILKKEQ